MKYKNLLPLSLTICILLTGCSASDTSRGSVPATETAPETEVQLEDLTPVISPPQSAKSSGNKASSLETDSAVFKVYTGSTDRTAVTLYKDGTATAKVDSTLEIPESDFYFHVQTKDTDISKMRLEMKKNMEEERLIPSEGRLITDVFMLPPSPSISGDEAYAVIQCQGYYYYHIDLAGAAQLGRTPVIKREFIQIRGMNINKFEFRTTTPLKNGSNGKDFIFAITDDKEEILVYDSGLMKR
jgi:hypothetical protein